MCGCTESPSYTVNSKCNNIFSDFFKILNSSSGTVISIIEIGWPFVSRYILVNEITNISGVDTVDNLCYFCVRSLCGIVLAWATYPNYLTQIIHRMAGWCAQKRMWLFHLSDQLSVLEANINFKIWHVQPKQVTWL